MQLTAPGNLHRAMFTRNGLHTSCKRLARASAVAQQALCLARGRLAALKRGRHAARAPGGGAALLAHCRAHLAGFKVPQSITTVQEFPRTDTSIGKIQKHLVRSQMRENIDN